jgi:dipeptidyl-peptidase-4
MTELSFPRLAARTRNFTHGQPRSVTVSSDGAQVLFLRSSGPTDSVQSLWAMDADSGVERLIADPRALLDSDTEDLPAEERALRERRRESSGGIVSYACNAASDVAVFALSGRLFRADFGSDVEGVVGGDVEGGVVTEVPSAGPVLDPRPDPTGERIAYITGGALHVVDARGDVRLAGEEGATWGLAEFIAAEEMSRFRGYWWSPDGTHLLAARVDESPVPRWHIADPAHPERPATVVSYPHAGAANARVTLHVLSLDGSWVDVRWDSVAYEYLVTAAWDEAVPLITVSRRDQRSMQTLTIDPKTGQTTCVAMATDPAWVEVVPGTPRMIGRGLVTGGLVDGTCGLLLDGKLITPPDVYVRGVAGSFEGELLVEGTRGRPEQNLVWRLDLDGSMVPVAGDGYHSATAGGSTLAVASRSLQTAGTTWTVHNGASRHVITSLAQEPPFAPAPLLARVTSRGLPTAVLYPRNHVAGTALPVLMDPYGGPHHQEVVASRGTWLEPQWWADQGFAVVVVDGRGTPGVSPEFERAIRGDFAGPVLEDQAEALQELASSHPDLDLGRVGIRGWSFGGYLAALAVLRRPDVFHAAIAGAPVTDWRLYDTHYTERYLGHPDAEPDSYARSSIVDDAPALTRPLMLIHGLADDNVVAAHTLALSGALLAAGRPHQVLPLTGVTHMASNEVVAENLLLLQLDFLRRSLLS